MGAWHGWYHVDGHTYGTWVPGDPRGWREKRHKKHVEGDYLNPPLPGTGDALHAYSHEQLKHTPVHLTPDQREAAGKALVEMLVHQDIELIVLSLDAIHYHLLGRFGDGQVRQRVGRAKKHAYFRLREQWPVQKVWQRLSNVTPITDRAHQLNVFDYIQRHKDRGAWAWTYRQGLYWQDPNTQDL